MATYPKRGMGMPLSLKGKGEGMVTFEGEWMATYPTSLKGECDGFLSILSKEDWRWGGHLSILKI